MLVCTYCKRTIPNIKRMSNESSSILHQILNGYLCSWKRPHKSQMFLCSDAWPVNTKNVFFKFTWFSDVKIRLDLQLFNGYHVCLKLLSPILCWKYMICVYFVTFESTEIWDFNLDGKGLFYIYLCDYLFI